MKQEWQLNRKERLECSHSKMMQKNSKNCSGDCIELHRRTVRWIVSWLCHFGGWSEHRSLPPFHTNLAGQKGKEERLAFPMLFISRDFFFLGGGCCWNGDLQPSVRTGTVQKWVYNPQQLHVRTWPKGDPDYTARILIRLILEVCWILLPPKVLKFISENVTSIGSNFSSFPLQKAASKSWVWRTGGPFRATWIVAWRTDVGGENSPNQNF